MTFALSTIEQVFSPPFGDASGGGYGHSSDHCLVLLMDPFLNARST